MKHFKSVSVFVICLVFNMLSAQNTSSCVHCNMLIKDKLHKASAEQNGIPVFFDAIECLIIYIKDHDEATYTNLKVTDYQTGAPLDAETATLLKSKAIPSPMGANLSAFKNAEDAINFKNDKGGETFTWNVINAIFRDTTLVAQDQDHHDHNRPDAHAPIGIMGDHLHNKGGFMVSFRYMNMVMNGNKSGTENISNESIYNSFMAAPQEMTMNMYMLGVMYAPTDKLTLMLMQNYVENNMDLKAKMPMPDGMVMFRNFATSASGLSDLNIGAMYGVFNNHNIALHLNVGVNIPVGDINKRDDTPMINDVKLPYAMQLGSGTFDARLGATFKRNATNTSWGTQLLSTLRSGKNSEDYRLGNLYQLNFWGAYNLSSYISVSARVLGVSEGNVKGVDSDLNPMMVTTANINNYGSEKIKTFIGVNIAFSQTSSFKDLRFGIEAGAPLYENYDGIQMNENLTLNFGLKYNAL